MMLRCKTGIFAAVVFSLLIASTSVKAGSGFPPNLYRDTLFKFLMTIENVSNKSSANQSAKLAWAYVKNQIDDEEVLSQNKIATLIKDRNWSGKKTYDIDLAAYREIGDKVQYAYYVVTTDKGPYLWTFKICRQHNKWLIYYINVEFGVDSLAEDLLPVRPED